MGWSDLKSEACSIAGAMSILGDRWTLLILRDAINGVRRFADFQGHLGIPRALLSKRLALLEEEGLMEKRPYQEPGERRRYEYRLTAKGIDLQFVLIALREWGDRHVNPPGQHPVDLVEKETQEPVRLQLARASDGQAVSPRNVRVVPGPGFKAGLKDT